MREEKVNKTEDFTWYDKAQEQAYNFLEKSTFYDLKGRLEELAKNGIKDEAELKGINNNFLEKEKFADWYFEPIIELNLFKGDIKKKFEKEVETMKDGEEKSYKEFWIKEITRYQDAIYNDPLDEIMKKVMKQVEDIRNRKSPPELLEFSKFKLN